MDANSRKSLEIEKNQTLIREEWIPHLENAAREAGTRIMEIHQQGAQAEFKNDGSPVTEADRAAEEVILSALNQMAPEIPVVSEENAESHHLDPPEIFFLVDPLDGTKEFLRPDGQGSFTVNIALIEKMEPVLGVIFAPALDRMFHGFKGGGSVEKSPGREGPIRVRQLPESGSRAVASRSHRNEETNRWLEAHQIRETVSIGSSLKFCLVACGEADVYPRFGPTMEWDTAAGDAILRAAGGLTTNPDGSVFRYGKAGYRNSSFIAYGQPDRWEPKASV